MQARKKKNAIPLPLYNPRSSPSRLVLFCPLSVFVQGFKMWRNTPNAMVQNRYTYFSAPPQNADLIFSLYLFCGQRETLKLALLVNVSMHCEKTTHHLSGQMLCVAFCFEQQPGELPRKPYWPRGVKVMTLLLCLLQFGWKRPIYPNHCYTYDVTNDTCYT